MTFLVGSRLHHSLPWSVVWPAVSLNVQDPSKTGKFTVSGNNAVEVLDLGIESVPEGVIPALVLTVLCGTGAKDVRYTKIYTMSMVHNNGDYNRGYHSNQGPACC